MALTFGLTGPVLAQSSPERTVSGQAPGSLERFGQHEDSFVVWNQMRNNRWAAHDERAFRAHYSFKYSFCGPRLNRDGEAVKPAAPPSDSGFSLCPSGDFTRQLEIFAAYTGEFDFYAGTRDSGPVINRLSQPGLFVRMPFKSLGSDWTDIDSIGVGIEHRSNGQVADVSSPRAIELAQANYVSGNRPYFDTISRGANFVSLTLARRNPWSIRSLDLQAKLLFYIGQQDSQVTWGPLAGTDRRFSDHDRLQLRASWKPTEHQRLLVDWMVGDRGLAAHAWTLGWSVDVGEVPLYVRWHRGPMNTLSNYTQRQDSLGVGLLLSRF